MKKQLLLLASLIVLGFNAAAQSTANLVIFAEDGDLFFAYVNGIRQNDNPQANVKITGLTSPNLSLRIEFNDKALPQLKQNMALEMGFEHTAKIKRDTKKQLKLRYFGQAPLSTATDANTVAYHTTETPAYNVAPTGGTENTSTSTTVTTTQTYNNNVNPGSVNMNMGGVGITMNVNGMDPNAATMNSTTSTTVTSTSSSSGSSSSSGFDNSTPATPSTPGNAGCASAMSSSDFSKMKSTVEAKPFSDTRMSTAKVATKNACLSVNQIKEISKLFNMDDDKLIYAKYAYDHCVDKANYYQVGEVFSFSSTSDELNKFLEQN